MYLFDMTLLKPGKKLHGQIEWRGNPRGQPGDWEPCYVINMLHMELIGDLNDLIPATYEKDERWKIHCIPMN